MAFELTTLRTDKEKEKAGVWVDYDGDSSLLIARDMNPKHSAFMTKKYRENRRAIDRGDEHADEIAQKITTEGMAKYVLLGWKGITINGEEKDYSAELGMKIMKEIPDFRDDVQRFSREADRYRVQKEKEDADALGEL